MPTFSKHSRKILNTCHPKIQSVFDEVVKTIDCRAISGRRDEDEQNELYRTGKSQLRYPDSYHNKSPHSKAVDIVPYPIDWSDRERFTLFAGFVLGIAEGKGIAMIWGGDWNGDFRVSDNRFDDFAHFQLLDKGSKE